MVCGLQEIFNSVALSLLSTIAPRDLRKFFQRGLLIQVRTNVCIHQRKSKRSDIICEFPK